MAMRKQTLDELEPFFAACKVLKINPEKWLSDVLDKIPFTPKEKLSELLPQNWIKSNPQAIV